MSVTASRLIAAMAVMLLAMAPPSQCAAMVIRLEDFAALKYAVCEAELEQVLSSVWSVHPGGFAILLRLLFPMSFSSNDANAALALISFLVTLWMIQRFLERALRSKEGQISTSSRLMSGVFAYSVALSPSLAPCWFRFTEEVAAAIIVVGLIGVCDSVSAQKVPSRRQMCFVVALSVALIAIHVYGAFVAISLLTATLVSSLSRCREGASRQFGRRAVDLVVQLFAVGGLVAYVVVCLLFKEGRWQEILNHYWAQPLISADSVLPLFGMAGYFVESDEWAQHAVALIVVAVVSVTACFVLSRSLRTALLSASVIGIFLTLACAERANMGRVFILQHAGPLVVLLMCFVGRLFIAVSRGSFAVFSMVLFTTIGIPETVERLSQADRRESSRTVLAAVASDMLNSGDPGVVIAGSRLFFLLGCEEPELWKDTRIRVYSPLGHGQDQFPGRVLVPDLFRSSRCPLGNEDDLRSWIYVQMTASQMIRCDIHTWDVDWFKVQKTGMPSIGEIYTSRLISPVRIHQDNP